MKEKLFLVFRNFHWETALMLHLHFLIRSLNLGFHQSQGPHPSLLDLPLAKQNLNNPLWIRKSYFKSAQSVSWRNSAITWIDLSHRQVHAKTNHKHCHKNYFWHFFEVMYKLKRYWSSVFKASLVMTEDTDTFVLLLFATKIIILTNKRKEKKIVYDQPQQKQVNPNIWQKIEQTL